MRLVFLGTRGCIVADLVSIPARTAALSGLRLYVGDGASLVRPIVRWAGGEPFGHASIRTQLDWCRTAGVGGDFPLIASTEIVGDDDEKAASRIRAIGHERGVEATLAYDGLSVVLRRFANGRT